MKSRVLAIVASAVALLVLLASAMVFATPALAQDRSAYEVGLQIAQRRSYGNSDCYARVFARHAVVVERASGRLGWHAASTPAYNAEQISRCGVDRRQRVAIQRQRPDNAAGPVPYRIGLGIAAQRGFYGPSGRCFARVFQGSASQQPSADRNIRYGISGQDMPAFNRELQLRCGLSQ